MAARAHAHALHLELGAIKHTLSWRLTAPLRSVRKVSVRKVGVRKVSVRKVGVRGVSVRKVSVRSAVPRQTADVTSRPGLELVPRQTIS
jgi:hypothetical protein